MAHRPHLPKKLIATLSAAGLATGLASCSSDDGAAGDPASATSRGPISFAMGKVDAENLVPVIDKWNEGHPDEKVTLKELAGEVDAQRETLVQSLQAGASDYDVMALDVVWTAQFAANGWLAPLTGDLAAPTDGLLDAPVESSTYNGTLYALPQNTNGQLLFRNTEMVPDAPSTWDDVVNSCKAVVAENKDCLTTQLKQYEGITINTGNFMDGWGGGIMGEDDQPTVTSDASREGLQALVDAYKDGTIASSSTATTEEETSLAFTEGKTAMAVNWPFMWGNANEADATKGKFEVQPLVGKDGTGVSTLGGYNNGINVNSKHKATALDFMKFIEAPENQKYFAEQSLPPVLSSIYDDAALVDEFPYLPVLKQSLETAKPRSISPNYDALTKAVQDNAYAAVTGSTDVDQATTDMNAAIRNVI